MKAISTANPFTHLGKPHPIYVYRDHQKSKDAIFTADGRPVVMPHKAERKGKSVYVQWTTGMFLRVVRCQLDISRKELAARIGISDDCAKKLEKGSRRLQEHHRLLLINATKDKLNKGFIR